MLRGSTGVYSAVTRTDTGEMLRATEEGMKVVVTIHYVYLNRAIFSLFNLSWLLELLFIF